MYKNNILTQYFQNQNNQKLILAKKNIWTLPFFMIKRTLQLFPYLILLYLALATIICKIEVKFIVLMLGILLYSTVIRISKNYLNYAVIIVVCLLNIWKVGNLLYLLHFISILLLLFSYIIFYHMSKRKYYFKLKINSDKLKLLLFIVLALLGDEIMYLLFKGEQSFFMLSLIILSTYLIFDYDCELVTKLYHNEFFNMYKLAYTLKQKKVLLNWKKIKNLQMLNIILVFLTFSDVIFGRFNYNIFFTKVYLLINVAILYYFNLDVFIRSEILKKSQVYENKFLLYVIKGWIYLPVILISWIKVLFAKSLLGYGSLVIIATLILSLVYYWYCQNWRVNEK